MSAVAWMPGDGRDPLDLLTPDDVAGLLKVPKSTVYALCRERRIPFVKVGRRYVFQRAALAAWIDEQLVGLGGGGHGRW